MPSKGARPPRGAPRPPTGNLPDRLTSFVGRAPEIATVRHLIDEHRLVTLTGAGGVGKTRLALEVADALAESTFDEIRWVDLQALSDAGLVPATTAAALGMSEPREPIGETICSHLADRHVLLVLDSCEHLVDACAALVSRLLVACRQVRVLATSREPFNIPGEATLSVPSLGLVEPIGASDAVRLFVDRAKIVRSDFSLNEQNEAAVAEICRRLDGIPLALELAAARLRVLTVDEIAAGLADRFHLLTGTSRAALPRQRTLEGSVDWSHELLDDRDRALFRRLAVFPGTFTLDAAESVAPDGELARSDILDRLSRLVDRSLVQVVEHNRAHARYRMLETIRDYALQRLDESAEADDARERHLTWCVALSDRAAGGLRGADPRVSLEQVDAEMDNIRAALDWSRTSAAEDAGARIVGLLALYWFVRGEVSIGRDRLESAVLRAGPSPGRTLALSALSHVSYRAGDMALAARWAAEAVAEARECGDDRSLGVALHFQGWVRFWGEADRTGAWASFERAAELLRPVDDRVLAGLNLALLGWSYVDTSQVPRARPLLEEALALLPDRSAPRPYALFALGWLEHLEGRAAAAEARLEEALAIAGYLGDHYVAAFARALLVVQSVAEGRVAEARRHCEEALAIAVQHRLRAAEASIHAARASSLLAGGRVDEGIAALAVAASRNPMPWQSAILDAWQAQLALATGHPDDARRLADRALALGTEHDSVIARALATVTLAALAQEGGAPHDAEDLLHGALAIVTAAGFRPLSCQVLVALAGAVAGQGRLEEAVRLLAAADAAGHDIGPLAPMTWQGTRALASEWRDVLGLAFDVAWADGRGLSLDEAIAYASRGRGRRRRPAHGWKSLTPTESKVVALVTEGLTNPQIGQRLFISPRTVQTHLARVFAKLGVSSRAQLAAAAALRSSSSGRSGERPS